MMLLGRGAAAIKGSCYLSVSYAALAMASPAFAQCTPDPAPPLGAVTCTGTDPDGIVANSNGVSVTVEPGASVAGITAGSSPTPVIITINNSGTIQSAANESILGLNTNLFGIHSLTNNASGQIGAIRSSVGFLTNQGLIDGGALSAVRMVMSGVPAVSPSNLQNSGTIRSTADTRPTISYLGSTPGFLQIFNTGVIANNGLGTAIQAGSLVGTTYINNTNSGTIVSAGSTAIVGFDRAEIYNEGLIQSSADAIIFSNSQLPGGQFVLNNFGTINGSIRVTESNGAIARTTIYNSNGTINGSVILGSGDDIVYTRVGNITGAVDGGAGTDTYQLDFFQDTVLSSGLATPTNFERLNVGLGDKVRLTLANGFTLNGTLNIAMPQFGGGTATLVNATNLVSTGTAIINSNTSPGLTFINTGSIATTHTNINEVAVRIENAVRFENSGTLTATGGGAVNLIAPIGGAQGTVLNSGTITADGVGVSTVRVGLINPGSITSNQAIGVVLNSASVNNSGQISGAIAGVALTQGSLNNTGTVSSAAVGVRLNGAGSVDNRAGGVITGGTIAIEGLVGATSKSVRNAGTINGDVLLGGTAGNSNNTYVAFVGGILNGNLNLGSGGDRFVTPLPTGGANPFASVTGTVTGAGRETIVYMVDADANWVLGTPPAPFSAESYDLANNVTLNLTAASAQAYNTSISGWGRVNLTADLTNNSFGPILTVGAATPRFGPTTAGGVNVTSNGTLTTTRSVVGSLAQPAVRVFGSLQNPFGFSSFTNAGTINVNDLASGSGILTGIAILNGGTATNSGTINLNGGISATGIAISAGGSATNSGTINLNGGIGVTGTATIASFDPITGQRTYNFATFENSGSITQVSGGIAGRGVIGVGAVRNTGSIVTGGDAVIMGQNNSGIRFGGTIDNSGLIQSINGIAISTENLAAQLGFDNLTVINRSTGTITGGPATDAIRTIGSILIDNAGTINGNVSAGIGFGGTSTFLNNGGTVNGNVSLGTAFAANGVFMSNGGTVTGNLTFDAGNDMFVSVNGGTGVNGTITAGAGIDTYVAAFTSNTTIAADGFALPSDFERRGVGAIGSGTIVTVTDPLTGLDSGFYFFGDGTIVNQATFNRGPLVGSNKVHLVGMPGSTAGLDFVNQGNIYDGISGSVRGFDNSGRIGLPAPSGAFSPTTVQLFVQGADTFRFSNSGMIAPFFSPSGLPSGIGTVQVIMSQSQQLLQSATLSNSGYMGASTVFDINARDVAFLNTGTITAFDPTNPQFFGGGVQLNVGDRSGQSVNSGLLANRVSFENLGTINGYAIVNALSRETNFSNSGLITGDAFFRTGVSIYVAPTLTSFVFPPGASQSIPQFADQDNLRLTNSGVIGGTVLIEGSVRATEIVNTGTISVGPPAPSPFFDSPELALNVGIETVNGQTITLNNSGTINNSAIGGSAVGIGAAAGFADNSPAGATATITVTNSGNILANGGAVIESGTQPYVAVNAALLAIGVSTGASQVTITNGAAGVIESNGIARTSIDPASPSAGFAAGDGSIAIVGSANRITFNNAGTVTGGAGMTLAPGSEIDLGAELTDAIDPNDEFELAGVLEGRYLPGAILFFNSIDTVSNTGTINGSVDLGAFDDSMSNLGAINGNVFLRSGNDAFLQGVTGSLVGTVDGGIGADALTIDATGGAGTAFDMTRFVNFESLLVSGSGSVGLSGALDYDTINLHGAGIVVGSGQTLSTLGAATITGTAANERLTNSGAIAGSVLLGAGDDSVTNAGTIGGTLDFGEGTNSLNNSATGILSNTVLFGSGNDSLTNAGQIAVAINLGAGTNNANNSGTIGNTLGFGAGDDSLQNSGTIAGLVDMGAGVGTATNSGTLNGGILFADASDVLSNSGTINGTLALAGGDDQLGNSGQINTLADLGGGNNILSNLAGGRLSLGAVAGAGNDQLQNAGVIDGAVQLGDGNNVIVNTVGGLIAGLVTLGSGADGVSNEGTMSGALAMGEGNNTLINLGTMGSTVTFGSGDDGVDNKGTIAGLVDLGSGVGTVINSGTLVSGLAAGDAADVLTNSGTINGLLSLSGGDDQLGNSGQINALADLGSGNNLLSNLAGGTLAGGVAAGAGDDRLQNAGTISGPVSLGEGNNVVLNSASGQVLGLVTLGSGNDGINNEGVMNGALALGEGNNTLVNVGTLGGTVSSGAGDDQFGNSGNVLALINLGSGNNLIVNTVSGVIGAGLTSGAGNDQLQNAGTMNGLIALGDGANILANATSGILNGDIQAGSGVDQLNNAGQIVGAVALGDGSNVLVNETGASITGLVSLGAGNDVISNAGTLGSHIFFADGNNQLVNTGSIGGSVTSGSGVDSLTNSGTINGLVDLGSGTDTVLNTGALAGGLAAGDGNDLLSNSGTIAGQLALGAGADEIGNAGRITVLADLGDGNNILVNAVTGILDAGLSAGAGDDQLGNSGTIGGAVSLGDGTNVLVNLAGASMTGTVALGAGNDAVSNDGTISGQLTLGDGNNTLANGVSGLLAGVLAGGGNDTVTNAGRINSIALGNGNNQFSNSGTLTGTMSAGTGDDLVINNGTLAGVSLGGGKDVLSNNGTISGTVDLGDQDDTLFNIGRLTGAVDLGAGTDMFVLRSGSTSAAVSGGAGSDQVTLVLNGTEAAPDLLDLSAFSAFEALRHESGVGLLSNTANFGLIDVVAGRLIGAAGSTINSNTIMVARGATFGSAGTVTGTVIVNGTLSPGASPGTMTVNGNVGFNQGSTALFELTPTTTDKLVVNGVVVIAAGSTLNIVGTRPITPGVPLDLISATGGISGSFQTITKSNTIFGFTRMQGGSLQLLGLFLAEPTFNPQVTTTVNYVNSVLQSPQTPAALLAALPSLVTASGATNTAAFSQLHPEVFASASQIGIENGLALSKAIRATQFGTVDGEGRLFAFAQGFGNWRQLAADADSGTARANIGSYGLLSGLGFGSNNVSVSVFAGYVEAKQEIAALGSTTTAKGIVAGASGRFSSGGFHASAIVAYDGSSATTARSLFNGSTAVSKYDLRGWTIDLDGGYKMSVSDNWSTQIRFGLTHIAGRRWDISETGGVPFDLDVLARKTKATFVDGELIMQGGQSSDAKFRPWLSAGVRHQLSGDAILATSGFKGLPATLTVAGAERSKTLPILGAGMDLAIGKSASFFVDYHGEFGKGTEGQNVNAGVRIRF